MSLSTNGCANTQVHASKMEKLSLSGVISSASSSSDSAMPFGAKSSRVLFVFKEVNLTCFCDACSVNGQDYPTCTQAILYLLTTVKKETPALVDSWTTRSRSSSMLSSCSSVSTWYLLIFLLYLSFLGEGSSMHPSSPPHDHAFHSPPIS